MEANGARHTEGFLPSSFLTSLPDHGGRYTCQRFNFRRLRFKMVQIFSL